MLRLSGSMGTMLALAKESIMEIEHKARLYMAYHEAGHAVVSELLGLPIDHIRLADKGHLFTSQIAPIRLVASECVPVNLQRNPTAQEFVNFICAELGGLVAEGVFFGKASESGLNDRSSMIELMAGQMEEADIDYLSGPLWGIIRDQHHSITEIATKLIATGFVSGRNIRLILSTTGSKPPLGSVHMITFEGE